MRWRGCLWPTWAHTTRMEKYSDISGTLLFGCLCFFFFCISMLCVCFYVCMFAYLWAYCGWEYTCGNQRMGFFLNGSPHNSLWQANEHRPGRIASLVSNLSLESYLYLLSACIADVPLWSQCWNCRCSHMVSVLALQMGSYASLAFMWILTLVLMFAWQVLYPLTHLSSTASVQ